MSSTFEDNGLSPDNPWLDAGFVDSLSEQPDDPLHTAESQKLFRQLLEWFYYERDRQAVNRLEMAMDALFYDGEQWDVTDAAILRGRGQLPLVYNEIAPMVDWLIGTERRSRVDWKVLPCLQDDVAIADIKTKTLKYVSDVNRVPFQRSRAFADCIKVGVGWVDDGARDDPTQDVLYSKYEDWRNVLWDSNSYELDLSDARYIFRWRWVDEDIAIALFPHQAAKIHKAARDQQYGIMQNDDLWYLGENRLEPAGNIYPLDGGHGVGIIGAYGGGVVNNAKRHRVKLIECQFRQPAMVKIVASGPLKGSFVRAHDQTLLNSVNQSGDQIIDKLMMRVHVAVFTESDLLSVGESPYRHNQFSLTPFWCYRRGRDRLPYGVVRRVRDIQLDLNKRASKALFMLNTNQIIADEGAIDDLEHFRDEADRPDGVMIKKTGKNVELRRDTDAATGQINMMSLASQTIQKVSGVNNENLGRETNAISGAAIQARQNQGSVSTTEPFDNYRLAVQVSGEKQLSLTEQFYSEEKVIRLSGAKGGLNWIHINKPEIQPDGSLRFLNDITASKADFVVDEADYNGTLRQVMFDSLQQLVQKLPPEAGLKLFAIAMDYSDLPNHDEIAQLIRKMTGDPDPNQPPSPEQIQAAEQQQAMQQEALRLQRQQALLALEEQKAKIADLQASAQATLAKAKSDSGDVTQSDAYLNLQKQTSDQIERLTTELQRLQVEMASRTVQIQADADTKLEIARINSDTQLRIAELKAASDERLGEIGRGLDREA